MILFLFYLLFCRREYNDRFISVSYTHLHAYLYASGRAEYVPVTDDEAVDAFEYLSRLEGIIPAIESAHAVAHARKIAPTMSKDDIIIICLSGRGDKDVAAMAKYRGVDLHE